MSAARSIVVVGSINMDLVVRTPRLPRAGETVLGSDLLRVSGGKGANQAVAVARLGKGEVHMVGRVGDDEFGRTLLEGLIQNGIDTTHVFRTQGVASGCAMIAVDSRGENSIVVSPGANAHIAPADIDAAEFIIRSAAAVLLQLEIPLKTVQYAVTLCKRLGVTTILDPAPMPRKGLPAGLRRVDVLTPNEHEGRRIGRAGGRVVFKLGPRGAVLRQNGAGAIRAKAFKVNVVDTTAAGDAFAGALAVALAEEQSWRDALRFANAAGAVCCTRIGAQHSLPTRAGVERLIASTESALRGTAKRPRPVRRGPVRRPARG